MKIIPILTTLICLITLIAIKTYASSPIINISACGTLSANNTIYSVTQNINTASTGDCLLLSGNNDTLNINGFNLQGPGASTSTGAGIHITGSNDVIEGLDGLSVGFGWGVRDQGVATVGDNFSMLNDNIGLELAGTTDRWTDLASENNLANGIYYNSCLNGCSVEVTFVFNNGASGVLITGSSHPELELFVVTNNKSNGIHVGCSSGCTGNTAVAIGNAIAGQEVGSPAVGGNTADGIFVDATESGAADQVYLTTVGNNGGIDLHDATATCGNNQWIVNTFTTSNAGGVVSPACLAGIPTPGGITLVTLPIASLPVVSSNSITGIITNRIAANNAAVCWIEANAAAGMIQPPSGYTLVPGTNLATPLGNITGLYQHVYQLGDTLAPVFGLYGKGNANAICAAYKGANGTIPVIVGLGRTNTSTTTLTSPSINPLFPNNELLMLYATDAISTLTPSSLGSIELTTGANSQSLAWVDTMLNSTGNATGNQTIGSSVSTGSVGVQAVLSASTPIPPTPTPTPTPAGNILYVDSNQAGYNGPLPPAVGTSCSLADAGPGTSIGAPKCTLAGISAMQTSLKPDQQVLFKRGDVWTEELTITNLQGLSGHPVILGNYGSGAMPVIEGSSARPTCINAIGTTAKYITVDGLECRNTTQYGMTFQTSNGGMPGITVQNSYIHNTGPGAFAANTTVGPNPANGNKCAPVGGGIVAGGCDDGNYRNQLDGEDFSKGSGVDNFHFINNIVNHCGGHNCLQVHYDGGAPVVQTNVVGPGCVHNCIDLKGSGTFGTTQALITQNTATTGVTTCSGNCSAAIYIANSFHGGVGSDNLVTLNTTYNSAVGFQTSPDANCTPNSGTHCPQHVEAYNNTWVSSVYGYLGSSCEAPSSGCGFNEDSTVTFINGIIDGGIANVNALVNLTENHNDCGGHQGKAGAYSNFSCANAGDLINVDPLYTNFAGNNFTLTVGSPLHNAGLAGTGTGLTSIGANP